MSEVRIRTVVKTKEDEDEDEIEAIFGNFPRKRIGCWRCPVNLRKLPYPIKLPDIRISINEMDMDIPNNRI